MVTLVRRARQRLFQNELISEGAYASIAILLAFILLLLLGTQILDWRWTVLVTTVAVAAGLYRARKHLPVAYTVAQIVDHRLGLADALSTALYFSENSRSSQGTPAIRELQLDQARTVSDTVDVRKAIPFTLPRALYLAGVLLLVAGSLFALRYGLSRSLDLRAPLASMLPFQFGPNERPEVARDMRRKPPQTPEAQDDTGAPAADPDQLPMGEPDPNATDNSDSSGDPNSQKSGAATKGQAKAGDKGEQGSEQEAQAEQSGDQQNGENSAQQGKGKQDQKSADGKQDSGKGGEGSSLMSKVQDALKNLLSSVKPPQSNPNQGQNDPNNQQGKGQQNQGKQQPGKNGQQQNQNNPGEQDGQNGDQQQSPQEPQGKGDGKSDSQQATKQPGGGIGNQDGDKSIKQAADLAAMGKLSEIMGKRSANLTGEATVEVQSTSQQLKTPYAQRTVQHAQNGAEISRDEIPVAMQPYVQQYFEQVRKQAAPPAAPPVKKQ